MMKGRNIWMMMGMLLMTAMPMAAQDSVSKWHYAERFPPLPHMTTENWFTMPTLSRPSWMQHPVIVVAHHNEDDEKAVQSVVIHRRIAVDSVETKKRVMRYKLHKQYEKVDNLQGVRDLIMNHRWKSREEEIGPLKR